MNKITIVFPDKAVSVNGLGYQNLDFSGVPTEFHALQWNGTGGWIEYPENEFGEKPANEKITELPAWVIALVSQWEEADKLAKAKQAEFEEAVRKSEEMNAEAKRIVEAEELKRQQEAEEQAALLAMMAEQNQQSVSNQS